MSRKADAIMSLIVFGISYLLISDWKLFLGLVLFGFGMNLQNKANSGSA